MNNKKEGHPYIILRSKTKRTTVRLTTEEDEFIKKHGGITEFIHKSIRDVVGREKKERLETDREFGFSKVERAFFDRYIEPWGSMKPKLYHSLLTGSLLPGLEKDVAGDPAHEDYELLEFMEKLKDDREFFDDFYKTTQMCLAKIWGQEWPPDLTPDAKYQCSECKMFRKGRDLMFVWDVEEGSRWLCPRCYKAI